MAVYETLNSTKTVSFIPQPEEEYQYEDNESEDSDDSSMYEYEEESDPVKPAPYRKFLIYVLIISAIFLDGKYHFPVLGSSTVKTVAYFIWTVFLEFMLPIGEAVIDVLYVIYQLFQSTK